jgi:hypothetical protein
MIYNGFGCRDRPSVLENLFHMMALNCIRGKNGDQNVGTIHLTLVLDCFKFRHFHADDRSGCTSGRCTSARAGTNLSYF